MMRIFIMIFFCSLLFCSLDPVIVDSDSMCDYYVFCTLTPLDQIQYVLVGRSVPEGNPIDISNANVTISTDDQTVKFQSVGSGIYQNLYDTLRVMAGATYRLRVEIGDGKLITAETTLPDLFYIVSPLPGDTLDHYLYPVDTLKLPKVTWSIPARAHHYSVFLNIENSAVSFFKGVETLKHEIFIPDIYPESRFRQLPNPFFINAIIYVFARDSTDLFALRSRRYLPYGTDVTFEQEFLEMQKQKIHNANVNGALGRFNGLSVATLNVVLRVHKSE